MSGSIDRRPGGRPASLGGAMILVVASLLVAPAPALAVTPVDGGAFTIFPVPINVGAGDQFDPHVSGDLVSYTDGAGIRTYDFFSGDDLAVPRPSGAQDLLSDVSGDEVVFSRIETSGQIPVVRLDLATNTLTKVDPTATQQQFEAAIGSATVAFSDGNLSPEGELVIATIGGSTSRVTTDDRTEYDENVAPGGDVVVYDSCGGTSCDVRQATPSGTSWVVTTVLSGANVYIHDPDTDGSTIVYDDVRAGDRDIYWQPVGGGPEGRLQLPGDQIDPAISEGLVFFRSIPVGEIQADLYVYEIDSNRLFRITSTPSNEDLTDIASLGGGRAHLVWSSGEVDDRDVYGATVELPPAGPTYHFGGFQQPVDARPTLNQMKAGAAVPVKFSLGGNQGLSIFAAGSPRSQVIACDATADVDGIEQTVSAGGSSLTYDPSTDTYSYVWKTDKAWAGTCRQLVLAFADGSVGRANFKFK